MVAASLLGVWAASRPAVITRQWVPVAPSFTEHYFLVVSRASDGSITAFVRNPEYNAGRSIGTHTPAELGAAMNTNGTLTLRKAANLSDLRFYRATPEDLRWFYPLPTASWQYRQPQDLGDGWRVGTLAGVGMREAPVAAVIDAIAAERAPALRSRYIQSIALERHGTLVLDQYFYGFTADQPHDVRSAGKSVTTLMVGSAISETGAFTPASRVLALLPQYAPVENDDARKRSMSVADLMTMSSGLACDDNDDSSPGNEDTMQSQPDGTDWYRYALDLPMVSQPGTQAVYCSAGINLLGAIVATTTHVSLHAYFDSRFAGPMQFGRYEMWLMPPPAGAAYMGGGDRFRPRDFLKFGALLLERGRWNGRRIVDPQWIAQSLVPRSAPIGEGDRYGYGWHLSSVAVDGRSYDVISAGGNGGQLMIVVPSLDLAMMVTAGNYNQFPVWRTFLPEMVTMAVRGCGSSVALTR
jgi:CubicO group peptidase (beta-lactamase class C family)